MSASRLTLRVLVTLILVFAAAAPSVAQDPKKPVEPEYGQPGKDVVWVPTSPALVQKMLDLAGVTPADYVIDLGPGAGEQGGHLVVAGTVDEVAACPQSITGQYLSLQHGVITLTP